MSTIHVVVGGQFGSEGKGHFVAQLARRVVQMDATPMVVRTGGPNAGHCVLDGNGHKWKLRHLPTPAVVHNDIPLALAAGCEIDDSVLYEEIRELELAGIPVADRLSVDAQATYLAGHHKQREQTTDGMLGSLVDRIGSTGKGIGAARAARTMREADTWGGGADVQRLASQWLESGKPVIIEGTQGYGLGLHAGFYPQCTSRDVRACDLLGEVGLHPWQPGVDRVVVWVVFRPNPIRVAGNSGPLKGETSWAALGLDEEFTTVTGKVRRVGEWDGELARHAMTGNGAPSSSVRPVLMFADYIDSDLEDVADATSVPSGSWDVLVPFEEDLGHIYGFGTGPNSFVWRHDAI